MNTKLSSVEKSRFFATFSVIAENPNSCRQEIYEAIGGSKLTSICRINEIVGLGLACETMPRGTNRKELVIAEKGEQVLRTALILERALDGEGCLDDADYIGSSKECRDILK